MPSDALSDEVSGWGGEDTQDETFVSAKLLGYAGDHVEAGLDKGARVILLCHFLTLQ
jgi:hypothetical protein